MKNTLKMLLAAVLVCTLANAEDYSEKIKETAEECNKILDDMFFTGSCKNIRWDTSIEGSVRASEKIKYGPIETTGWWIGHRKNRIKNRINNLKNDAAAEEVLKSLEMRIEENTKKLIPLIPYNVVEEAIEMNYNQLVVIPYLLCRNDLRSKESDCEEIYRKMSTFANEIIAQRRETEPSQR